MADMQAADVQALYPAGPAAVPADLTLATPAYRQRAWLAMAGLAVFVLLYLALSAWFAWAAWKLISAAFDPSGRNSDFWHLLVGGCAAFLAVFMLKALFFVRRGGDSSDLELRADEEPQLFAFLHRLADEAGAPRPHRVYLSANVNAAVFYDLSIANLLLPSRKNLLIGLGLVNVLTLGEFKAVLAHEFGHFAQRSTAVGRWVYVAQQIAGHIVAKRDLLDKFLRFLSRIDLRVAWVGWILSLVVWSIRSLMDVMFRLVVLAQRALSREMEFQADLVAVSLTGSDALVHALHRLGTADQAFERALGFAGAEFRAGRPVRDVFALQTRVIGHMRHLLDEPGYGLVPPLPQAEPQGHRLFKQQIAQTPRMWATHPPNLDREHNAKRRYIPAPLDERSAWTLFRQPEQLRERMSLHLLGGTLKDQPVALEDSLARLDAGYRQIHLDPVYRGAHLGRSIVCSARTPAELYDANISPNAAVPDQARLYPPEFAAELALLRERQQERAALEALKAGVLSAPGGVILHRGREIRRTELPAVIAEVRREIEEAARVVAARDRSGRSAYLGLAQALGGGWADYLRGLIAVLHYADHGEADLRDAQGAFSNVLSIVTADGRVSGRELKRLLKAASQLHEVLRGAHANAREVQLDAALLAELGIADWAQAMGALGLEAPDKKNIGAWIEAVNGWCGNAIGLLDALGHVALKRLLAVEAQLARHAAEAQAPDAAPAPSRVQARVTPLLPGGERPRQIRLDLWDRFQLADGLGPALARTLLSVAIVGAVLWLGSRFAGLI